MEVIFAGFTYHPVWFDFDNAGATARGAYLMDFCLLWSTERYANGEHNGEWRGDQEYQPEFGGEIVLEVDQVDQYDKYGIYGK